MRKTALEVLDSSVSNEDRHAWLASASVKELYDFLRWVKQDSSWALHGRDCLNVLLAKEDIVLQRDIKRLTVWIFLLTLIMTIFTFFQIYKTFINPNSPVTSPSNAKTTITKPTHTADQTDNAAKIIQPDKTAKINHK